MGNFNLYPNYVFKKLKKGDQLYIGFDDLKAKIVKIKKKYILLKANSEGFLENNKGVHLENRKIKLKYLTNKDFEAIKIAKRYNIKNYALSFTSSSDDIKKFELILKKENKIYKIETKKAINNLNSIIKEGSNFLIDRGDLSKETSIEDIPMLQRKIFKYQTNS
jgi:pyruvate kinase